MSVAKFLEFSHKNIENIYGNKLERKLSNEELGYHWGKYIVEL